MSVVGQAAADVPARAAEVEPRWGSVRGVLARPSAWLCILWLALIVVMSALATLVATHDPLAQDTANAFALPSAAHWLGTDSLGRDTYSRLVHGGGYLLLVANIPVAVSYLIGVPVGLLAGYLGGKLELVTSFSINVLFSVPGIVVTLAVAAATDNSLVAICLVLGVVGSGAVVRLVRASTVATKNLLYVDAARVARLPRRRILLRHILPNVAAPLIVQGFLVYGGIFLFLTALSFLSLGFSPETPSWGQMTYEASQNMAQHPWAMVPIGAVIILTVLALNTLGSTLLAALPSQQKPPRGNLPAAPRPTKPSAVLTTAGAAVAPAAEPVPDDILLRLSSLAITIPGVRDGKPLVEDICLDVRRGRTLALVGESGSGKTLTALAIGGLLPHGAHISAGHVLFDGLDLAAMSDSQLRRIRGNRVAFVSQEPMVALDPCFSVRSLLLEAIHEHSSLGRRAARARAAELLSLVGIGQVERVLGSFPHQLSGGMAQRVAIAVAISGEPDLLVADEPTTALDVTVQAEILDLLRGLQARLGMTTVIVTHDFGVVADLADDVAVMYAGQIVERGTVDDVLLDSVHPYSQALLAASGGAPAGSEPAPLPHGSVPPPDLWPESCRFANRCPYAHATCLAAPVPLVPTGVGEARCVLAKEAAHV